MEPQKLRELQNVGSTELHSPWSHQRASGAVGPHQWSHETQGATTRGTWSCIATGSCEGARPTGAPTEQQVLGHKGQEECWPPNTDWNVGWIAQFWEYQESQKRSTINLHCFKAVISMGTSKTVLYYIVQNDICTVIFFRRHLTIFYWTCDLIYCAKWSKTTTEAGDTPSQTTILQKRQHPTTRHSWSTRARKASRQASGARR